MINELYLAEQGDAYNQYQLGKMYHKGKGVEQNYAKAFKWYQMAAAQGDPASQHQLGVMYEHGLCVPQNYTKAISWYQKAVEEHYTPSEEDREDTGWMYEYGITKNYAKALKLLRKANTTSKSNNWNNLILRFWLYLAVPKCLFAWIWNKATQKANTIPIKAQLMARCSKAFHNCQKLRDRFEGQEAIYFEKIASRVRVTNIRCDVDAEYITADIEEIPFYELECAEDSPMRWSIGGGDDTFFSDHTLSLCSYGIIWSIYFQPEVINNVTNLAAKHDYSAMLTYSDVSGFFIYEPSERVF